MGIRRCGVSFQDGGGCRHLTEVYAETVLGTAAMGVRGIKDQGFTNGEGAFNIDVEVHTFTTHQVQWTKLKQWLEGAAKNPKEHALKVRLR